MPSILLIEDDVLFREALTAALAAEGYAVTQAADGDVGVARFKPQPTNLVLTDIVMPNKEGLETIQALRCDHPKLGIIAMSGGLARDAPAMGTLGRNDEGTGGMGGPRASPSGRAAITGRPRGRGKRTMGNRREGTPHMHLWISGKNPILRAPQPPRVPWCDRSWQRVFASTD